MIQLLHTCEQMHVWPVRCDFSDDGLLYPDPLDTVCKVCFTMGAAQHPLQVAYRICQSCIEHYGIVLTLTERGYALPEFFPMVCPNCGKTPVASYYGNNGVISLPNWAFMEKKQQNLALQPMKFEENNGE